MNSRRLYVDGRTIAAMPSKNVRTAGAGSFLADQEVVKGVTDAFSPATTLGFTFQSLSTIDGITPSAGPFAVGRGHVGYPRKTSAADSELHLGLGMNITDGGIAPGPSPPVTPNMSPLRRAFVMPRDPPAIPVTPSRAGSKAMQMLGPADLPRQGFQSGSPQYKGKKRDFFRPLPRSVTAHLVPEAILKCVPHCSGVARELDTFWGGRAKPSKKSHHITTTKDLPAPPIAVADRLVGQGATMAVVDGSGQVWHDLEEQAEFAWLLSEQGRGIALLSPIHLRGMPSSPLASSPETEGDHLAEPPSGTNEAVRIVSGDQSETDEDGCDPFGVPGPWRSVFNVPDSKNGFAIGTKVSNFLGVAPGEAASRGLAFLSTDPYAPRKTGKGPSSKRRPPPLALGVAARIKPTKTIAVQQDFVATSFVAPGQRPTGSTQRKPDSQQLRGKAQRISMTCSNKGSEQHPAVRWDSNNSFIDTSKQESRAVSMSMKVGGIFRAM